jgi:hypothetical protein
MLLQVDGLDRAQTRFRHLWGSYVLGFKPALHCRKSFWMHDEANVRPGMKDGEYELDDSHAFFYLCSVGIRERHHTNVHLAVTPRIGSVAAVGSIYGVRFTIQNAQSIPINHPLLLETPPQGLEKLTRDHIRCKNFQFGCQVFDVDEVGDAALGIVVTKLR